MPTLGDPPTRNVPGGCRSRRSFFRKGVGVMIARAASEPPLRASAAAAATTPAHLHHVELHTDDAGRCHQYGGRIAADRRRGLLAIAAACSMPSGPVHAFAHPLLTTMAVAVLRAGRAVASRRARGPLRLLVVKTPARAGTSEIISARLGPRALMPHETPAARNPSGAVIHPCSARRPRWRRRNRSREHRVARRFLPASDRRCRRSTLGLRAPTVRPA